MKRSIKNFLSIFVVLAVLFITAACGSNSESTTSTIAVTSETVAAETTTAPAKEIKTLTVMGHTSWLEWKGGQAVFDMINANADLGVKLEIEKLPEGDQGDQVALTRYAAGEVPDLLWWYGAVNKINAEKEFAPLNASAEWTKNFGDGLKLPAFTKNNVLYGVPLGESTVFAMFYNKKVFADAGVQIPKTWDEFLAVCDTIKAKGITPVYYSGKDAWTLQIIPAIGFARESKNADPKQIAADIESNKMHFADLKATIDAIAKTKELQDKGYTNKTWLSDTYQMAQQALLDGKCAMYPQGSWVLAELGKLDAAKTDSDIGALAIPFDGKDDRLNVSAPYSMFVSKKGKNVEIATKVAEFIGSSEAQNAWFNAQPGVPFTSAVKVDFKGALKDISDVNSAGILPAWDAFLGKGYDAGPLDKYMQDLLAGSKTPTQVMEAKDKAYQKSAKAKSDADFK